MASQDHPDPLTDWVRTNRHWLALAALLFLLAGRAEDLFAGTVGGLLSFVRYAGLYGLVMWMLGSHRNRNRTDFWPRFVIGWGVVLAAEVAFAVTAAVRGTFGFTPLLSLGYVGSFVWFSVFAHRCTRRGLSWNGEPVP